MRVETQRLVLREYEEADWERVHLYTGRLGFSRFEEWGPYTEEQTRELVMRFMEKAGEAPRREYELAVVLKDGGLLIGGCSLKVDVEGRARLGYMINPDYQGRGYATEAALGLIRYGFMELGLRLIRAGCDAENGASRRVMEKAGMRMARFVENDQKLRGEARSSYYYEVGREEYLWEWSTGL